MCGEGGVVRADDSVRGLGVWGLMMRMFTVVSSRHVPRVPRTQSALPLRDVLSEEAELRGVTFDAGRVSRLEESGSGSDTDVSPSSHAEAGKASSSAPVSVSLVSSAWHQAAASCLRMFQLGFNGNARSCPVRMCLYLLEMALLNLSVRRRLIHG